VFFDQDKAERTVKFISLLNHTKGVWYGQPFELLPWQDKIIRDVFGTVKEDGYRQYNTAYVEVPKKNGKSELAAAVALYLTCGDGEWGAEVYGCAADRQQASIVFDVAVDMVEQSPALKKRIKPVLSRKRLVYMPTGSFYQVLSSEAYTKHGFNVHGVVFDELHAQPNRQLYDVMTKGSGDARIQPLFFLITTAGTDRNSICFEVHQKAEDILRGKRMDPTFYPVIYGIEEGEDWLMDRRELDFSGRTQLYYQLYDILYDDIKNGVYKPKELLPTENELIERYGVSRVTVRKAMDMLLNEGIIGKKRGYGSFVLNKKVEQTLNKVLHFSNEMEKRGYKSSSKMLINEKVYANKTIAEALSIAEGTPLLHVNRLRFANNEPMCIESAYLIYDMCPDVLCYDFSEMSLRNFLVERYNIIWKRAHQKMFAVKANARFSKHLNIEEGDPMIYIERISYTQDDQPGEYLQSYYRGDCFYLTADLEA
jgi:DNA-binding GntR family transcriptional regulator